MLRHVRIPSAFLKGIVTLTLAMELVIFSMAHHAQAEFENPPVLSAKDILEPNGSRGPIIRWPTKLKITVCSTSTR